MPGGGLLQVLATWSFLQLSDVTAAVGVDRGLPVYRSVSQLRWFSSPLASFMHFLVGNRAFLNHLLCLEIPGYSG